MLPAAVFRFRVTMFELFFNTFLGTVLVYWPYLLHCFINHVKAAVAAILNLRSKNNICVRQHLFVLEFLDYPFPLA